MPWVLFSRAWTWTPPEDRRTSVAYAAAHAISVRAACKRDALASGAATAYTTPKPGDPRVQVSANGVRFIAPGNV
jgi:hypothetical protein